VKFQHKRSYMLWRSMVASACVLGFGTGALAASDKITAGSLADNLEVGEQGAFLAGVIEGLATARFYADGKEPEGMSCIYDWYYDEGRKQAKIQEAFARYPDASPGRVLAVLIRQECGG